jgi:ribosomal protein S3
MPITVVSDARAKPEAEQITIKTNRGRHVVGNEGEVIDSLQAHKV